MRLARRWVSHSSIRLSRLATAGHLVGFAIALVYAAMFESRWGGGRTPGKRLLDVTIVGRDGALLSPLRAALRGGIFSALLLCTGLGWFVRRVPVLDVVLNDVGMLATAATLLLFLFNLRTRQGLHDLAVGSFVVRGRSLPAPTGVMRAPVFATCICIAALSALFGTGIYRTVISPPDPQREAAIAALESRSDVAHADVFLAHRDGEPEAAVIWAWLVEPIDDPTARAASIATTVREAAPSLLQARPVQVRLIRSVTLGFFFHTAVNQVVLLPDGG